MGILKKLVLGLLGLVVALGAVGLLLPGSAKVERSILIERPPAAVFAVVNDFSQFNSWSPWYGIDPAAKYTLSGPQTGVGATLAWAGNADVGSGTQRIIASVPDSRVDCALAFDGWGEATASFVLEPEGSGTRIRWSYESELGLNPLLRWMGLFMDGWVGGDYEKGLAKLKALLEAQPSAAAASQSGTA